MPAAIPACTATLTCRPVAGAALLPLQAEARSRRLRGVV